MAESLSDLGFQANFDPENGNAVGVIDIVQSVDAETRDRQHSGNTYLKETAGRTNITVLLGAQATKIILEAAKEGGLQVATAVEFTAGSQAYSVKATKEVILAAGTFM
jgi:choline dehydrogenase-like flavoprotein